MKPSSKSKTSKKTRRPKTKSGEAVQIKFRERRFCDIDLRNLKHPKPNKDYKATLPGPPGWQYKIDPGA